MSIKMNNLIQQLVSVREVQNISQTQLADTSGLSRMTIVRVEHEKIDPRLSTIQVMARAMGLELILVPKELTEPLQDFIRSGGKYFGQPQGIDAPLSIVDSLKAKASP
jgi:DNA-binding XRE family transcriptional regulator